jgi:hypothetical protein
MLYESTNEPGFTASERTALMTTIPISAVGQEENLTFSPRFDENGIVMIPEDS